jgi:hypothetical protein
MMPQPTPAGGHAVTDAVSIAGPTVVRTASSGFSAVAGHAVVHAASAGFTAADTTTSSIAGALINRDAALPPALRKNTDINGGYVSWMHDNGAGNHSYSPCYSDFDYFTDVPPTFFGGIAGGASTWPTAARGTHRDDGCIGR